jgi:peptidoglycan/xylan/chitin deacetylase (PgdA/CDA1 family)
VGSTVVNPARSLLRMIGGLQPSPSSGVTILAYHLAGAGTGSPVDLPFSVFERQMHELARSGRVVALDRALELLAASERSDERLVVLCFDDAYRNFHDRIWPLLSELQLPAMLYVPVEFVEGKGPAPLHDARDLPPATWEQLRELADSRLVMIGSHGLRHVDLRRLSPSELQRELGDSRRVLEKRVGRAVTSFCYPRALSTRRVVTEARRWYGSAVAAGGRTNRSGTFDPHLLSRVPIRRDMPDSLEAVLRTGTWLEEWAAAKLRQVMR